MQRRAAAAYFVFFLVVSVAAYAYIGVAESQRPEVTLDAEAELTNDSTFTAGETTYTVSNIQQGSDGGSMAADLAWTNESSQYTATLENGSTTTYQNDSYLILTDGESGTVTLREQLNVTRLLSEDDAVEDTLATRNGTDYVVYRNNSTLRPLAEWLPEPDTVEFQTGENYPYTTDSGSQQTTIATVDSGTATLEWIAPRDRSAELSEGGNVTLDDGRYFAHFPDQSTVQLVPIDQYGAYEEDLARQDYFHERKNGLWGISILSGIGAVLVLGMAYLPVRG
ncbi:hypothetical protein [Haloarcula montana]|uniref:hypothetical protein n=1 Tax=Haloarcula montana TaxID=3111776 RepID=UPI002D782BF2|nr:hypothetical protein [Haloarcula sp. GH36]